MISSKQIVINGLLINYYCNQSKDAASPVVFLHGWRSDAMIWQPVLEILDAKGIKFYALDLLGFGKSDKPNEQAALDDYVGAVVNFLERISGKADLVGHSFGGRIAIKLASKRPDLVSKLILVDSAGFKADSPAVEFKKFLAKLFKPFFAPKFMTGLRFKIYRMMGAEDYLATPALQKTFVKVIKEDLSGHLNRILQPTLIIWGENDAETPLEFAHKMNENIPNSKLTVFPNSGHFPFLDNPAEFAQTIIDFL